MGTERDEANVTHTAFRRPRTIALCLVALVGCGTRGPRTTPPTFEEYSVAVYTGPVASLVYDSEATRTAYGARIEATVRATGPLFAGQMAFVAIGCGDGCVVPFTADLKTGRVRSAEGWGVSPLCVSLEFRPASRLVIATPAHTGAEQPSDCPSEVRYWEWTGERFDSIPVRLPPATGS